MRSWAGVIVSCAAALAVLVAVGEGDDRRLRLVRPDGDAVPWTGLVERHGPMAVLLWASWAPGAEATMARASSLRRAAAERGLDFVVVDVQEPLREARRAFRDSELRWLHDRHGDLLKRYRVLRLPRLLVIDREGKLLQKLPPRVTALERVQ